MSEPADVKWVKCQRMVENLLGYLEAQTSPDHAFVVSSIMDTRSCDGVLGMGANLGAVRDATARHLNRGDPTRADRVANNEVLTAEDLRVVSRVSMEYRAWYARELASSLSWPNWARYQLTESPNDFYRGVATGLVVAGGTGSLSLLYGLTATGAGLASAGAGSLAGSGWLVARRFLRTPPKPPRDT